MTLRMSDLFENNVKQILSHYKYVKKRGENRDSPTKKKTPRSTRTNGAGPSTSQNHNSGDSDDDDDDQGPSSGRVNGRSRRTHAQSNGVSSSSNLQQTNKRPRKQRFKSSADESNSSDSSSESSDNSDESSGIPLADLGKTNNKAVKKNHKKRAKKQNRGAVSSSSPKKTSRATKRRKIESEDEQEPEQSENESEEESKGDISSPEPTNSRRSNRNQPKRRIQSSSDDNSGRRGNEEKRKRVCRRPKRYESDQSFHIDGTNKKTVDSDSDHPRATRESAKKKFMEWAQTSEEDDGNDDDDFDQKPQTSTQAQKSAARRSVRKKVIRSESDQSEDKKSKALPSRRSARTLRHSQSQSQEDESNDSDHQDRPSTSTNVRNSGRINGQPPIQTSTSSRTTRSSQNQSSSRSNNDHNYGEPGPSSSAIIQPRETRSAILSRHQRNADELDRSGLEDSSLASNAQNPRLLRLRSANLRAAPTPTSNFEALNGIRRTTRNRVMHNYFEEENDNAEEETDRFQPSHQNQSSSRTTRNEQIQNPSDDSDSYSEEDKTPLKSIASSNSKKNHEHNTRNGTAVARVKRNLYSDDEQVGAQKTFTLISFLTFLLFLRLVRRTVD